MCGRYTLRRPGLLAKLEYQNTFEEFSEIRIVWHPGEFVPAIRMGHSNLRELVPLYWGFIPFWTKGPPKAKPINAKSETVGSSAMFRESFNRRRCLMPADGFFEPKGPKTLKVRQPYFFQRPDRDIFAFAGIWDRWRDPQGEAIESCTLLTVGPNDLMRPIHDRMPVILDPENYDRWLDPSAGGDSLTDLLKPLPNDQLEYWQTIDQENPPDENQGAKPGVKAEWQ